MRIYNPLSMGIGVSGVNLCIYFSVTVKMKTSLIEMELTCKDTPILRVQFHEFLAECKHSYDYHHQEGFYHPQNFHLPAPTDLLA